MFLPNFPISFLILFFEISLDMSPVDVSPLSLHQNFNVRIEEGRFILGKEGLGPRVRSSKGPRSLSLGPSLFS